VKLEQFQEKFVANFVANFWEILGKISDGPVSWAIFGTISWTILGTILQFWGHRRFYF
jgi:hypothetical protein